jgi:hypothetical protein
LFASSTRITSGLENPDAVTVLRISEELVGFLKATSISVGVPNAQAQESLVRPRLDVDPGVGGSLGTLTGRALPVRQVRSDDADGPQRQMRMCHACLPWLLSRRTKRRCARRARDPGICEVRSEILAMEEQGDVMKAIRCMGLASIIVLGACGGGAVPAGMPAPSPQLAQVQDRQIIERGSMEVTVEDLPVATTRVEGLVANLGGRVESSRADGDKRVRYELRVPAESLRGLLADLRLLGDVEFERVSSTDVTEQLSDLSARIGNLTAVRDRLRVYLDRAETLDEVMAVERELTRIQSEIDVLTARLERLTGRVAMSELSLELNRRRSLGPLGLVASGAAWVAGKLVFID